jgi:hypothetical protein
MVDYLFLYHFHSSPKFSYKNLTYNLILKVYLSFFILYNKYYFGSNIFITYKIFTFCWFKNNNNKTKFQTSRISSKFIIKFGVHILSIFWNVKNCILWQQFWGTLNVLLVPQIYTTMMLWIPMKVEFTHNKVPTFKNLQKISTNITFFIVIHTPKWVSNAKKIMFKILLST